jgi:hypothetical protein
MTSDKFVRITLVVIAVSLFKIAFFDVSTIKSAYANQVNRVVICDELGIYCAGVTPNRTLAIHNFGR